MLCDFKTSRSIATENLSVFFPLDLLAASHTVSRCLVNQVPYEGELSVKVILDRPFRVCFSHTAEETEALTEKAKEKDPVLQLTAAEGHGLYVSPVVEANSYYEKVFSLRHEAVLTGALVLVAAPSPDGRQLQGSLAVELYTSSRPLINETRKKQRRE